MQRLATMNSGNMKLEKTVIKNQENGSINVYLKVELGQPTRKRT